MKTTTIALILILTTMFLFSENKINNNSFQNINDLKTEVSDLKNKINNLEAEVRVANAKISDLKESHTEQVEYYKSIHENTVWTISIIFLILSGLFTAFMWIFKRPDEIWKQLKIKEQEAKDLIKKLESNFQQQKTIFSLDKKGLYDYKSEDWAIIKEFSNNAIAMDIKSRNEYDWFCIGLWAYKEKKFQKAVNAFTNATEIKKDFDQAYKNLGNAYDEVNDTKNAIKSFENAIKYNPENDKALSNLGIIFTTKGQISKAKDFFQKAIKINPDSGYYYTNLFENDLVSGNEFDKELETKFVEKFQSDCVPFSIYEMLKIYKRISEDKTYEKQLQDWEKKYSSIGSQVTYKSITNWINKKDNGVTKENLVKAMNFFQQFEEK